MEGNLHVDQAAKEPEMMPHLHRVVAECNIGIDVLGSVVAEQPVPIEFVAVTIAQLRKALDDGHPSILFGFSQNYLGIPLVTILRFLGILILIGLLCGYNIELCQKASVKGVEFSFGLKFTKP